MANIDYPRLSGGIFFTLLLREKRTGRTKKQLQSFGSDGLAQRFLLKELIRLFDESFIEGAGTSFETNTSLYASCEKSHGNGLPFDQSALINNFNSDIQHNYKELHTKMGIIADSFLTTDKPGKMKELVYSILTVIKEDASIKSTDEFYAKNDGQPITKNELIYSSYINVPALLLGVWHYILMYRTDNSIGIDTFKSWHKEPELKGQKHKFCSTIGTNYDCTIEIDTIYDKAGKSDCTTNNFSDYSCKINDYENNHNSYDTTYKNQTDILGTTNNIQNQFIFNFTGNGINIGKADNVVIKNGKVVSVE